MTEITRYIESPPPVYPYALATWRVARLIENDMSVRKMLRQLARATFATRLGDARRPLASYYFTDVKEVGVYSVGLVGYHLFKDGGIDYTRHAFGHERDRGAVFFSEDHGCHEVSAEDPSYRAVRDLYVAIIADIDEVEGILPESNRPN